MTPCCISHPSLAAYVLFIASLPCLVSLCIGVLDLQWLLSHPEDIFWLCCTTSGLTLSCLLLGLTLASINPGDAPCENFTLRICLHLVALEQFLVCHQHTGTFLQPDSVHCCCDEHCSCLHCLHGNESVVDPAGSRWAYWFVAGSLLLQSMRGHLKQLNWLRSLLCVLKTFNLSLSGFIPATVWSSPSQKSAALTIFQELHQIYIYFSKLLFAQAEFIPKIKRLHVHSVCLHVHEVSKLPQSMKVQSTETVELKKGLRWPALHTYFEAEWLNCNLHCSPHCL